MKIELGDGWRTRYLPLLLLCVATGLYSASRGTDTNWDLRNYHHYGAYAFLHGRLGFDLAPAQLQTYFSPLISLPRYALVELLNGFPRLVAFLMGAPAGIYVFALGGIALRMARRAFGPGRTASAAAGIATALAATGAGFLSSVGNSMADATVAAPIMVALWLVLREADEATPGRPASWRAMGLAGLLAGIALSLKLTSIIYAAPLGLLILALFGLRAALAAGLAMLGAFLLLWGPWGFMLWREFGSPLFPMYNDLFRSPDFLDVHIPDDRFLPRGTLQALFYPFYWLRLTVSLVSELPLRDARVALGYLCVPVLLFVVLRRGISIQRLRAERPTILLLLFAVLAYAAWLRLFGIYRYLLVVESLSAVLVMLALARLLPPRFAVGAFAALAVLVAATTIRPKWGYVRHGAQVMQLLDPFEVPSGDMLLLIGGDAQSYLVPFLPPGVRAVGVANGMTPPGWEHGLARRIRAAIAGHQGGIWLVVSPSEAAGTDAVLAPYGLRAGECRLVRSNIQRTGHRFCAVERITPG